MLGRWGAFSGPLGASVALDWGITQIIGGWGVRSKWNGEPPYREIDFGFVFVRAVRAGEVKLRGRARGKSPLAEARPDQKSLVRQTVSRGASRCPAGVPPVPRGVPSVSRRCPAGVPWCPVVKSTGRSIVR